MSDDLVFEYLTRLGRLLQAEDRRAAPPLLPVQLHALDFLSRCNRYSDRPAVVAEYLGITKGTASQTLRVLLEAGLVRKRPDRADKRVVHLSLTARGQEKLRAARADRLLNQSLKSLSTDQRAQLVQSLESLLKALQEANRGRSFGVCNTCNHFQSEQGGGFRCGLTLEALAERETHLICREHETTAAA